MEAIVTSFLFARSLSFKLKFYQDKISSKLTEQTMLKEHSQVLRHPVQLRTAASTFESCLTNLCET